MNTPNKLTIFRIILVPILIIIPLLGLKQEWFGIPITWILADIIFIVASITDKLDGYISLFIDFVYNLTASLKMQRSLC